MSDGPQDTTIGQTRRIEGSYTIAPDGLIAADVQASTLKVWLWLWRHADRNGQCWPSNARLRQCTGFSERTIRRAIADLIELGYVERHARYDGADGQTTNWYTLSFTASVTRQAPPPVTDDRPPRSPVTPGTSKNLGVLEETSLSPTGKRPTRPPRARTRARAGAASAVPGESGTMGDAMPDPKPTLPAQQAVAAFVEERQRVTGQRPTIATCKRVGSHARQHVRNGDVKEEQLVEAGRLLGRDPDAGPGLFDKMVERVRNGDRFQRALDRAARRFDRGNDR